MKSFTLFGIIKVPKREAELKKMKDEELNSFRWIAKYNGLKAIL